MKRRIIIPGIAVFLLLGIGVMNLSAVYARVPLQNLFQQYEVNVDEVEDVLQDLQDEKSAQRFAFWAEKLDEAVHYGKITNEQKELIIDKAFDVQERLTEIGELPEAEQPQELQNLWQELMYWGQDRGLSVKQIKNLLQ